MNNYVGLFKRIFDFNTIINTTTGISLNVRKVTKGMAQGSNLSPFLAN
jgi:hypothetical protein